MSAMLRAKKDSTQKKINSVTTTNDANKDVLLVEQQLNFFLGNPENDRVSCHCQTPREKPDPDYVLRPVIGKV